MRFVFAVNCSGPSYFSYSSFFQPAASTSIEREQRFSSRLSLKSSASTSSSLQRRTGSETNSLDDNQDLNLPKSIVTRLAKGVLPPNTQIQGNAMLAMSKSATVFVNYLTTQ